MKTYIFTDGACSNNQDINKRKAGIGVFFGDNDKRNISENMDNNTNNYCEIMACIKAIKKYYEKDNNNIIIVTDSKYVIDNVLNNTNIKKNKDEIYELRELTNKYDVNYLHVNSHQKKPKENTLIYTLWYGNMMADKLATEGCNKEANIATEDINKNNKEIQVNYEDTKDILIEIEYFEMMLRNAHRRLKEKLSN